MGNKQITLKDGHTSVTMADLKAMHNEIMTDIIDVEAAQSSTRDALSDHIKHTADTLWAMKASMLGMLSLTLIALALVLVHFINHQ